jgi:NADH-quinone oxidoreductase subunit M
MTFPFLTVLALLPLLAAVLVAVATPKGGRLVGLAGSVVTLVYAGAVIVAARAGGTDLAEQVNWLPMVGASYALDLDGMGLVMVAMTVLLVPAVLVGEWRTGLGATGRFSSKTFVALVLLVESFALFSFLSFDLLVFYIFFEATLIPMYFLIGGWGGAQRGKAAAKFLLFGLAGGLVMLFGVIGVAVTTGDQGTPTLNLLDLASLNLGDSWVVKAMFICFFVAFALKAPMVPGHIWLPAAAAESTPGGAALMVGILDKLGTFGMIRVCLGVFPDQSQWATPVIMILALVSIFYGALAAIGSRNLMRLIAYTSISHFGFMVLGIFALTSQSLTGSIFYMVNHALSTGALYLVIGYLIKRRGSADVRDFGGLVTVAPLAAGFTLVAGLASCALPGTSSFVSEFMTVAGTWTRYPVIAAIAVVAVVLAAVYILWVYRRMMTGALHPKCAKAKDLTWRERWALIPLVGAFLVLGFWPAPALAEIEPATSYYLSVAQVSDPAAIIEEGR